MQLSQNIIFTNFFDENQVSSITSQRSEKAGKPVKRLKLGKQAGAGLIVQLVYKNPTTELRGHARVCEAISSFHRLSSAHVSKQ